MAAIGCNKAGFLYRQSRISFTGYKKRWFVLNGVVLKYFPTQDTSESNVLGVIDMARVVSVKASKNIKNGFEVSTQIRTYYMETRLLGELSPNRVIRIQTTFSSKTSEDRDEWIRVIKNAVEEARRLSTCSSTGSTHLAELGNAYSVIGGSPQQSAPINSSAMYSVVGQATARPQLSNAPASYSVVGGNNQPVIQADSLLTYSEVGQNVATQNYPVVGSDMYDTIPGTRGQEITNVATESLYNTVGSVRPAAKITSPVPMKIPLNDNTDSDSENEGTQEGSGGSSLKISSLMSKLSVESLDSVDSLDLTDNELDDEDSEMFSKIDSDSILPPPVLGTNYASEEIKDFFKKHGLSPSNVNFAKISEDYKLKLDEKSDYPAFDALKKFLHVYNLKAK